MKSTYYCDFSIAVFSKYNTAIFSYYSNRHQIACFKVTAKLHNVRCCTNNSNQASKNCSELAAQQSWQRCSADLIAVRKEGLSPSVALLQSDDVTITAELF
jgi:hypothetical protein